LIHARSEAHIIDVSNAFALTAVAAAVRIVDSDEQGENA